MKLLKTINIWRIIEPILLGSLVNIIINYIFNPENPDFMLNEFIVAWLFAVPITELNHKIDIWLEKKANWSSNFKKRFVYHLAYLSLTLFIILNVIGNIYIWIIGDSFHTWEELLLINSITFLIAIILTLINWTSHFYSNWIETENKLHISSEKFDELKSKLPPEPQLIELLKGHDLYKIDISEVQLARSEFGTIWIYFGNKNKGVFNGTLNKLEKILPKRLFFRAARNIIIHRESILALSKSTYGKIDLKIKENIINDEYITVSRPKASTFRKWYNSNST